MKKINLIFRQKTGHTHYLEMKAFILYNLYWFIVHIQKSCELTLCQSDDLMRLMLPLAKLAFQYTQEVPVRVTKYCQLMNRPCTASSAINLSQLLYLKKPHKIKTLKTLCFLSLRAKICFLLSGANSLLAAQQLAWVTSREHHGKEFFLPVDDNLSTRASALPQCGVLCFGGSFGQGPTSSKLPCLKPCRAFPM